MPKRDQKSISSTSKPAGDAELAAPPEFTYEVAISFLAADEPAAVDLADRLSDRMRVFVYPKNQEELAGTDGSVVFRQVFAQQARLVVVLYRPKWGQTKWTAVEEQAIHERRFYRSSDFVLLVNMEKSEPRKPEWFSDLHIRLGIWEHTPAGLADIVAYKVRQLGGEVRMETVEDLVARQKREIDRIHAFAGIYGSPVGVSRARQEMERLIGIYKTRVEQTTSVLGMHMGMSSEVNTPLLVYRTEGIALSFQLRQRYSNTLDGTKLYVELSNGARFDLDHSEHKEFASEQYLYSESALGLPGWSQDDARGAFCTSDALVERWMKVWFTMIHERRVGGAYGQIR